jgi:hypothetical protein
MIDPEELDMVQLPPQLRQASDQWVRDDDEGMALYVLSYRRRARGAVAGVAACVTSALLLLALLLRSPLLALVSPMIGAAVYFLAMCSTERSLRTRLAISRAAQSACVERCMADPQSAAKAAMLERGAAQVNFRR